VFSTTGLRPVSGWSKTKARLEAAMPFSQLLTKSGASFNRTPDPKGSRDDNGNYALTD
jgi:hypothetical protein